MTIRTGKLIQWNQRIASGCFFSRRFMILSFTVTPLFACLILFLLQQGLDQPGHLLFAACVLVFQFAFPSIAHMPLLVDQVDGRPELLAPAVPVRSLAIEDD